jgi:Flp pilus assembly protein TadG
MLIPFVRHSIERARRAIAQVRRDTDAFSTDRSGNVAITFAIAAIPVFGLVGAAVDYSRANAARTAMQVALDAAALAVAKEAVNLPDGQVQVKAQSYFSAQFNRPDVKNLNLSFSLVAGNRAGDFTVVAEATGYIDTSIAQIIGKPTIDLRATAQVRWGFKALELALALDNTGSMAQKNKMVELKSAVKLLFSILKANSKTSGDTKIAVIPFNTVVNIGTEYVDAPWMSFDGTVTTTNWNGCVADRDQPNDVSDTAPNGSAPTMFPAAQCGTLAKALPLTSDWDALNAMVDTMTPNGNTNVTIGMVWGWHALTQNEPFTQGQPVKPDTDKVLILLTDGLNTANRFTTAPSQIDARTAAVCDNIKQTSIRLFTVRVIEGNVALLQGCASAPNMFYDVQVASDLKGVFTSIAASLSGARLAR